MKSYSTLENSDSITSIALGGFDGMHLAHQTLFEQLDDQGAILVIEHGYANLTPGQDRVHYTSYPILYYDLDEIKHYNAEAFIDLLKRTLPSLKRIVVGYDFCFGYERKYTVNDLINLFDHEVIVIDEVIKAEISVHSRFIRDYLHHGDIQTANILLDRPYRIKGIHIKGQGLGAQHFFPTINVNVTGYCLPKEGVYLTRTVIDNCSYQSLTFLGHRLSTDGRYAIETHLVDIKDCKEFHVGPIEIEFLAYIRENRAFNQFNALKNQIASDIAFVKSYAKNLDTSKN